uniref:NADPH oxidase 4-like n=1 Tax=Styela clava TaxID=7725 RepID=UPI0019396704|nr:NADPH oxidase 4-like [Styela clava]
MLPRVRNYLVNEGAKLLILVLWLGVNTILFYFTFIYYYYGPQFYYLHQMLGYGLCISRATAACINLNACVILLPMCRGILRILRSFPWVCRQCRRLMDKSKSFHIACAYMLCLMSAIHCGAHAFNAVNFSTYFNTRFLAINVAAFANQSPIIIVATSVPGVSGVLMVACLLTIAVTASGPLRRVNYRRFWKTHHLFILFYALLLIHACSGILKYQSNTKEHIPGCFVKYQENGTNWTTIFPVPEAESPSVVAEMKSQGSGVILNPIPETEDTFRHPMPETSSNNLSRPEPEHHPWPEKKIYVIPEAEPHHPMPEVGPEPGLQPCDQPDPVFKSCATEAWMWISVPLLLYILERISRYIGFSKAPLEIVSVKEHPNNVIELEFYQKNFVAKPGQSVWLRCPEISFAEEHPFTLTSLPNESNPNFTIHMLVRGEWTTKAKNLILNGCSEFSLEKKETRFLNSRADHTCVLDLSSSDEHNKIPLRMGGFSQNEHTRELKTSVNSRIGNNKETSTVGLSCPYSSDTLKSNENNKASTQIKFEFKKSPECPKFYAHGPYGSAMQDVFRYDVSLCIAGGIGITPFAAVLNTISQKEHVLKKSKLRRIYLIWICKTVKSFEWFVELINSVNRQLWDANLPDVLNVYLHVTSSNLEEQESLHGIQLERSRLLLGRPNFKETFRELSVRHQKSSIGVFCCGPRSLNNAVRKQCVQSSSKKKVKFIFNKESF